MVQAGQQATDFAVLHCSQCDETVTVNKGDQIPVCPNGHTTYL
jgi:hypothetical protein